MRARQRDVLMAGDFDVAMLQEVRSKDLSLLRSEFDWTCHSLDAQASFRDLGVAILGRKGTSLVAHQQLPAQAFVNSDVYEELAAWFHQRHLVVDVSVPGGGMVRMMSAHATPATSRGPGNPKRGVANGICLTYSPSTPTRREQTRPTGQLLSFGGHLTARVDPVRMSSSVRRIAGSIRLETFGMIGFTCRRALSTDSASRTTAPWLGLTPPVVIGDVTTISTPQRTSPPCR
jgi:hypothetical protein